MNIMKKILLSLFFLTFLVNPFQVCKECQAQEGLLKIRINDYSGGMNSQTLADLLESNQAASMLNVDLSRRGYLTKRKGQSLFAGVDVSFIENPHDDSEKENQTEPFVGIGRFDPDKTTSYLVAASSTNVGGVIYAQSGDTFWSSATTNASAMTAGKTTEFVQANDLYFILNGYDNTAWFDGADFSKSPGYTYSSPPAATTGAWLRNYLFLAGEPVEDDWIYFSNNRNPTNFSVGDIVYVNTGDGQSIVRLEAFRLNELVVYKERSIFVLDITGTTPLDDWTVQPISKTIGCIASRSVVNLGNDQWFLSSNPIAVRSLVRSQFDKILVEKVSNPIQDILDRTGKLQINETHINKAAAILFDGKYLLAIPTGNSTVNNTVLVFDFNVNAWYMIDGWYPSDWVEFDNRLFYTDANSGRVIECFTSEQNDWNTTDYYIDYASTPTQAVEFTYQSKAFDFDLPENYKSLDSIEVEFDPTGDYYAQLYINLDNGGWASVGSVNLHADGVSLPFTLPAQLSDTGVARETFHLQNYGKFKKMQVMIKQDKADEEARLQRITIFARPLPWTRE